MKKEKRTVEFLNHATYYIEVTVSLILLAAVLILFVELIIDSRIFAFEGKHLDFDSFISKIFSLIMGVEFTKMLCRHTPEAVVDVLLFATSRQMVIYHSSIIEILLGVIAIAILFLIKWFFSNNNLSHNKL